MEIKTSDIRDVIQVLSGQKPVSVTTPPPPAIHHTLTTAREAATGVSLLATMSYKSLSGNQKNRDILIRRVIHTKGDLYIDGLAMDIQAPRLIKASHITEIKDIGSGRIYTNPYEFIQQRLGVTVAGKTENSAAAEVPAQDDFARVVERVGAEVTVLMYLVAIDNVRQKSERQKVIEYVQSRTGDLHYDVQELNEYLISLAPDEESFSLALAQALNREKPVVQALVETMVKIILSDNHVDERERSFLIRMMDLLESEGYVFNLPV